MKPGKKQDHYTLHNHAVLVRSGREYFDSLLAIIASAKYELHLQVYIFEQDETGTQIKNALIKSAAAGVQVYLLLDGFGSGSLSEKFIKEFTDAGIHFRWFGPMFSGTRMHIGRRMHHKVVVADAYRAIVGGINVGDRYNEIDNKPPWFDFAVKVEGEIAFHLHAFCAKKWKGFKLPDKKNKIRFNKNLDLFEPEKICHMRIRVNDRLNRKARIVYSYRNAIRMSNEKVIIVGAYFLPGLTFTRLMNKASQRGVKIILITGAQSDVWLAQQAMQYLYRRLLRNHIEIYEYTKATVHGKVLMADNQFVTLGSYDLNQLSSFINLELNLDIDDRLFAKHLHAYLEKTIHHDCIQVTKTILAKREQPLKMLKQWFAYRLLRIMFFITLFVSNKKDY